MRIYSGMFLLSLTFLVSCGGNNTAQIWTDRPEFALYGEYFNTSQNEYKVTVKYLEYPAIELEKSDNCPDIVAGSWLKNASTGTQFSSLNSYFGAKKLSRTIFYQRLLTVGRIDRNQYLLPVSFNVPALIFLKGKDQELSSQFTIDFKEIKKLSKNYNIETRGAYTRMGFSPLWNDNFLLTTAVLYGASFSEASPLVWDARALDRSMSFIYNWTQEVNTNNHAEEDFTFKYFIEPPEKLIQSGRILFSYMESSDLFTLNEESKNNLDFRWIAEHDQIPLTERSVYLGVPKKAKNKKAAEAFILWFFKVESQRQLMEYFKINRINENVFGICGGFSTLSPVTDQIFPRFYPDLLGRMPHSDYFILPNILPGNWAAIKEKVILPYLHDRARKENTEDVYSLERRLSDWVRVNR
jgi:ABC-type glycerol-3-phosphate transport system substrate-binding protein